jgi:hypothetical protein
MKLFRILLIFTFIFSLGFGSYTFADEIEDTIAVALEDYSNGAFMKAASNLDYASQQIRQKRAGVLEKYLPEPLTGWSASVASSQTVSAVLLGGGVIAERTYTRGYSSITIKIVTDSPMVQSISMMLTNPMIITASGGKLIRIKGESAIFKYYPQNATGDINIVPGGRFLISVSGRAIGDNDLMDYANLIDHNGIKNMP